MPSVFLASIGRSSARHRSRARIRGGGHAGRHDGAEVPVSRPAITSVIAQYTRDSELDGRCS
jgi:hypothetical protein